MLQEFVITIYFQHTGEFYTAPSAWDEIRNGNEDKHKGEKKFKAFQNYFVWCRRQTTSFEKCISFVPCKEAA